MTRTYNVVGDAISEAGDDWDIFCILAYYNDEGTPVSRRFTKDETKEVFEKYWDWVLISYDGSAGYEALSSMWTKFMSLNLERYERIFKAISLEYNPINNYDKDSRITTSHTGTIEHEKGTRQTNDYGSKTDTMTAPEMWTRHDDGAFNSNGNVTTSSKDTNSGGVGSTVSGGHTDTIDLSGKDTDKFGNTDTVIEKTAGNIGVTTSADLITGEIRVRQYNIFHSMVNDFMCENGFLTISSEF